MELDVSGFLFPNDVHVVWSLMIVIYPYVTGLVAGAFIVSSFYHVFGRDELRPVSRLSMVASLAFLSVATLPLLMHLGHPERAFNILITPNFSSAMSAFGSASQTNRDSSVKTRCTSRHCSSSGISSGSQCSEIPARE